jgi:putative iron-dependent peroxidase
MTAPQEGIFAEESSHHYYLEYRLLEATDPETLRSSLARCLQKPASREPWVVVGFGDLLWRRLAGDRVPQDLRPFDAIEGSAGRGAPSTQRDLLFWIHGTRHDRNFERALWLHRELGPCARLELDLAGFTYLDSRDLTGFVDGSANPEAQEARDAALLPEGAPGAGGSFVLTQRWVHELESFHALPVPEQEKVIGRTKADSVELEGEAMPRDSHVSRTDLDESGPDLKIYRRSAPYGRVGEHGLYFLAFSSQLHRFDLMLKRMYGVAGDGVHDRLIEFSRAVTGAYWFAPSRGELEALR